MTKPRPDPERGSVTAFVAVVATALVMVAGMAYDGGQILAAHAGARADAAKAARAGAQELDLIALRSTGEAILDPTRAQAAALAYLQRTGAVGTVTVEGPPVTVTVTATQPLLILPGADRTIVVTKTATATDQSLGP
jgi:hypothetical protein